VINGQMTTVTPDWTIRPVPGQLPSRWLGILLHLLVLVHIVFPFSFFFLPTSFWLANWSQDSLELRFFRHRAGRATNFLLTLYQNIALNGRSGLHSMELWQKFSYFFGKLFFFWGSVAQGLQMLPSQGAALAAGNLNLQHYNFR